MLTQLKITTIITLVFLVGIALDVSPFLRGPAPYPPEWRWAYQWSFSPIKLLAPLLVISTILILFRSIFKSKLPSNSNVIKILLTLLVLGILFQSSLLFFSRSGIGVLFSRLVHPGHNGYFTATIDIESPQSFLSNFNQIVLQLPTHASGHPPAVPIFYWFILQLSRSKIFQQLPISVFAPSSLTASSLWYTLSQPQQLAALVILLLTSLFSYLTIVPLYYAVRRLFDSKTALYSVFLYIFLPNVAFFTPLPDVAFPLFTATALYCWSKFHQSSTTIWIILTGLLMSLSIFFSLSFLPVALIFFLLLGNTQSFRPAGLYLIGLLILPLVLFLITGFNLFQVTQTIISGLAPRSYWWWLLYNPYDFAVFVGIPLSISTGIYIYHLLRHKQPSIIRHIAKTFVFTIILLVISGGSRAEVGRIWLPLVIFPIILVAYQFAKSKLNFDAFTLILILQSLQLIIQQSAWVMLW